MAVHQCPRCPLRFSFRTELEFHLREDHGEDPSFGTVRDAGERIGSPALVLATGRGPEGNDPLRGPNSAELTPGRSTSDSWLEDGTTAKTPVEVDLTVRSADRGQLPRLTLMPRWVVLMVVGLLVLLLGVGLVFGS